MVRPFVIGGGLTSLVANLLAELLGVLGEVFEQDLGGTQITAHPLGAEQRSEGAPEAEPIVAPQHALDQRAELVGEDSRNVAFWESRSCHKPLIPDRRPRFQLWAQPQPKLASGPKTCRSRQAGISGTSFGCGCAALGNIQASPH